MKTALIISFIFNILFATLYLLRELNIIKESKERLVRYNRISAILSYRDGVLKAMQEANFQNSEILRTAISTSRFLPLMQEYNRKSDEAMKLFSSISLDDVENSTVPIEEIYNEEVMNVLVWKFDESEKLIIARELFNTPNFTNKKDAH